MLYGDQMMDLAAAIDIDRRPPRHRTGKDRTRGAPGPLRRAIGRRLIATGERIACGPQAASSV